MIFHGDMPGHGRRHSVDTGGLAIALDGTGDHGLGHGWGSCQESEFGKIQYAFLQYLPYFFPSWLTQAIITIQIC
jgi:hypothetical protein